MAKRTAIYPGTFDPVTFGHMDVLERAAKIFDKVIVSVARSTPKKTMFTFEQRLQMMKFCAAKLKNVDVDGFDGLLVEYARRKKACSVIRGLRAISDFEYEFQMALTNRKIAPDIETVFLMPGEKFSFISSTLVREIARYNGDLSSFVPKNIIKLLKSKNVKSKK